MSVTERGVNTYLVRVYVGREPLTRRRIEINETVRGTLTSAKKVEAKLKGRKEEGRIIKPGRMTLDVLLDQYLDSARHFQAATTQNKNRNFLDRYVRPYAGSLPLTGVTSKVLQDLFNLLMDKKEVGRDGGRNRAGRGGGLGLLPNTVKIIRKLLAAAFNYAVRQKLVGENPVHGTRLPPVTGTRAAALTFEEAEALVSVKDEFWYGDAFVFQLHTGLRPQELMALVWEDVDFERGILRVGRACKWIDGVFSCFGSPKTMRSVRTIELASEHLDLLRAHRRKQQEAAEAHKAAGGSYGEPLIKEWITGARPGCAHLYDSAELIFPRPDGRVPNSLTPRLEFKAALRRANVGAGQPTYRWHDLRHTHASFLIKLDVPLTEVAARMGHSLAELVRTYAHVIEGKRSDAPDLFAKLVPVQSNKLNAPADTDSEAEAGEDGPAPGAGGSDCQ
jgi:integrase